MAAQVRAAGYALLVYTVNEPADAQRLLGWGVDCIVTDALDRVRPDL
jgi:glycerophosphoryl diester phosphodiesterase